ncbi:LysE family translocator [Maritalea sp.]|uniref:LysE family translocator n=1 Tax=Maritalea sp. TaxID=2003361 RepID=UPI003EF71C07
MTFEYFMTCMVVILIPGTGMVYAVAMAIAQGWRTGIVAAFASTLGIVPHMIAAITGLAVLMHTSALAFQIVKYVGVAYLLYLAWQTLRSSGPIKLDDSPKENVPLKKVIVSGIAINSLNPKLSIFFLAFLPQFVSVNSTNNTLEMLVLGAVFMALTFLVFALFAAFAFSIRKVLTGSPRFMRWFRRTVAMSFGLLAARLAVTEQ